ncbi:Chitin biosynthesis protein CHS5 [Madurella fahalii]|uniref:Chitin biosynthesis protein CHS5 n=1 Tax=Madurella fahalii TaxID=1157608 RepID=A0ABQ0G366_9PEZI
MLVSLTVGKVDAGVTVLLTPDKRLIEFPSILLPPDIASGSIVDINVARNKSSEAAAERAFRELQDRILSSFGAAEPSPPVLRCRNATQTSVVLEWDPIQLATADLISLALYRNGQKAGNIPKPLSMHTTKISGLAVDTEYTFHLVLRTTAGTFTSQRVAVRTHKMTDLSGITITTGILPPAVREGLAAAVERIGAKIVDGVRIDTTHFVTVEGRGLQWEKANELNIPVVRPEWVDACERNGRILGVTKFYLDAVRVGPGFDERPGTAGTAGTNASVPAPAPAPAPAPSRPSKDSQPSNGTGASRQPPEPAPRDSAGQKEEGGVESSSSDSEEEEDWEQKVKSPDEQKVLADERDQNQLATRLKPTVEEADESQEEEEASEDERGGKSPGDGASFQDVAL